MSFFEVRSSARLRKAHHFWLAIYFSPGGRLFIQPPHFFIVLKQGAGSRHEPVASSRHDIVFFKDTFFGYKTHVPPYYIDVAMPPEVVARYVLFKYVSVRWLEIANFTRMGQRHVEPTVSEARRRSSSSVRGMNSTFSTGDFSGKCEPNKRNFTSGLYRQVYNHSGK